MRLLGMRFARSVCPIRIKQKTVWLHKQPHRFFMGTKLPINGLCRLL